MPMHTTLPGQSPEPHEDDSLVRNILTILGFIIVAAIILWGLFHLLTLALPGVSAFFSRLFNTDSVVVRVSKADVPSGTPVDVSWTHRAREDGVYAFRFECRDGVRMHAVSPEGERASVPCGVLYEVPGELKNIRVVPLLSGTKSIDVPLTIAFLQATSSPETKRPEGKAEIRVVASDTATSQTPEETPAAEEENTASLPAKSPAGKPDLRVRIVSVGTQTPYGTYLNNAPMYPGDIAAVRFAITNGGTAASGPWYFTASLPMNPEQSYTSPQQLSLPAGYTGEYILQFSPVAPGGGLFSVFADAGFSVSESDESNNTAATSISMSYYTDQYQQYAPNYYQPLLAPYSQPYPYYGY